jgi:hypothetical protein
MQNRCTTCPRPIADTAYGCGHCALDLARKLDDLAAILPELETTISRQDRIGSGGARASGAEIPLPYRPEASERADVIRGELTTWARVVQEETGRYLVGSSLPALARYIADAVDWARYRQQWPEFHAALRPLLGSTLGLIDRPADKVYLGPCRTAVEGSPLSCWADVYARPGAAFGVCRECDTRHDVAKSREWLLRALRERLARPVEIAGVLRGFGNASVGYSTIARYAEQKLITAHGQDGHGRDLYRIGEVLDLHARLASRRKVAA